MTFAAINYLSISINLLLVVFVFVCILMTLLILMQRPKQEGLGAAFGAGVTDQVFGARTTNVLQRGTVYLATAFFVISLALAILIGLQNQKNSLLTPRSATPAASPAPAVVPEETGAPTSLSDELPDSQPAPAAPDSPEIPAPDAATPEAPAPTSEAPAPEAPATPESAPADAAPADSPEKTEGQ